MTSYSDDLCTGGTPDAKSEGLPVARAFDDNAGNFWVSLNNDWPQWIGYKFAEAAEIVRIRMLQYGASYVTDFKIQGSNDETNEDDWDSKSWTDLATVSGAGGGAWANHDFSNSTAYLYFRLLSVSGHAGVNWAINEIEAMEEETLGGTDGGVGGDSADAVNLTDGGADGGVGGDSADMFNSSSGGTDGGVGGDSSDISYETEQGGTDGGLGGDSAGRHIEVEKGGTDGAVGGDSCDLFNWTQWLAQNEDRAIRRFYMTLTGSADGETDVEIPISSFQGRLRTGDPSYLSVVVPYASTYVTQINARANGEIIVEMAYLLGGEESVREEIARVDLEDITIDEGPYSKSITLVGHKTETYVSKTVTLSGISYKQTANGQFRFRALPDMYLRPGDTVNADSEQFTAALITYIVSRSMMFMEVAEAI